LLAKLIVHGANRGDAADKTRQALASFQVSGIDTGIPFLQTVIDNVDYRGGHVNTRWLEKKLEEYTAA
jgi:acetyl/propionyl-CoA carboxylase alpha subunit